MHPEKEESPHRADALRRAALDLWYDRPASIPRWIRFLTPCLALAEDGYRAFLVVRDGTYAAGWRKVRRVGRPVISVGNLTVGGSGKSSFCLLLAALLRAQGCRVALVSHSYGGRERTRKPLAFRGDEGPLPAWARVGDEAVMMALADPLLRVVAGSDKAASLERASQTEAQVILLDDAFHRRDLHRDLDLVLFDAGLGLGNGRCLPRGPLREPPETLIRADAFVVSMAAPGPVPGPLADILRRANPTAPLLTMIKEPAGLENWPGREQVGLSSLQGRRILSFCGLGNPESFRGTLLRLGAEPAGEAVFRDHHPYSDADLSGLAAEARRVRATAVVTTLKDAVKIGAWQVDAPPLWVLRVGAVLGDPDDWLAARLHSLLR